MDTYKSLLRLCDGEVTLKSHFFAYTKGHADVACPFCAMALKEHLLTLWRIACEDYSRSMIFFFPYNVMKRDWLLS